MTNWQELQDTNELQAIVEASFQRPQLVFKHSTRCGISAHVLQTISDESAELAKVADLHYLDLIRYRHISNQIAKDLDVRHQSPQAILIKNGKVVHSASHYSIQAANILKAV